LYVSTQRYVKKKRKEEEEEEEEEEIVCVRDQSHRIVLSLSLKALRFFLELCIYSNYS
jgi:hypothetical protein